MLSDLHSNHSAASPDGSIILRPYQCEGVAAVRDKYRQGAKRVLRVLPTGGGKTIEFVYTIKSAVARGKRTIVVVHRAELLEQVADALKRYGVDYGVIASGSPETTDAPVQIAMVATLAQSRRLKRWRDWSNLVVIDECHHSIATSWARVLASQTRAWVLGVSASPERLDGRGLCEVFDDIVIGPSVAELIKAGWLSPFIVYEPIAGGPDLSRARIRGGDYAVEDIREAMDGVVIGSAVDEYLRRCPGVPAVVFCVDVKHSQDVAKAFVAAGVKARHVDGETPASERRSAIAGLADGSVEVICNCNLISEGLNIPAIGAVLLLRPTASLALYLQIIGRSLRPGLGKTAIILDFAGCVSALGMPDAPREWSLDSKPRRQRERPEGPRLRRCPSCAVLNRAGAHECVECGADLRTPKERREIEIALEEAKQRETEAMLDRMRPRERIAWAGADERRLRLVARFNGFKPGWAFYRARELAALHG